MKLISMTEFILDKDKSRLDYHVTIEDVVNYAKFLSRKLSLDMFVPADQLKDLPGGKSEKPGEPDDLFPELNDKLLFKDLQIKYTDMDKQFFITKKGSGFFVVSGPKSMFGNNLTIESLVHRDLELTENAVKLIFG